MVLLCGARHVGPINVQLSVWQLLPDGRPDVQTQPVHPVSVGRMLPGADGHEVLPAAEGLLVRLSRCEEGRAAELVVGNAVYIP